MSRPPLQPGVPLWCISIAPVAVQPVFNFKYRSPIKDTGG